MAFGGFGSTGTCRSRVISLAEKLQNCRIVVLAFCPFARSASLARYPSRTLSPRCNFRFWQQPAGSVRRRCVRPTAEPADAFPFAVRAATAARGLRAAEPARRDALRGRPALWVRRAGRGRRVRVGRADGRLRSAEHEHAVWGRDVCVWSQTTDGVVRWFRGERARDNQLFRLGAGRWRVWRAGVDRVWTAAADERAVWRGECGWIRFDHLDDAIWRRL